MSDLERMYQAIARDVPNGDWAVKVIKTAVDFTEKCAKAERTKAPGDIAQMHVAEERLFNACKWHDPAQVVIQ